MKLGRKCHRYSFKKGKKERRKGCSAFDPRNSKKKTHTGMLFIVRHGNARVEEKVAMNIESGLKFKGNLIST